MSLSVNPARLSLDNAVNLRDVGGLPGRDGGSTRHLVLLRSGSLRLLTASDARLLLSVCGVGVVVDLRTAREVAADGPSVLARAGVATLHLDEHGGAAARLRERGLADHELTALRRRLLRTAAAR